MKPALGFILHTIHLSPGKEEEASSFKQNPTRRSQLCHLGRRLPATTQHFKVKFMTEGYLPGGHGESAVLEARGQAHATGTVCCSLHCMTQVLYATALYTTGTACH